MSDTMGDNDYALTLEAPSADVPEAPQTEPARGKRSKTESMQRVSKRQLALWQERSAGDEELFVDRPLTRGDCVDGVRPCPYVSCKHHLYLDVNPITGSVTLNFPNQEPDELEHSCALDIADNGGGTLEMVGGVFNLTRERIRQIEGKILVKLKKSKSIRAVMEAGGFDEVRGSPLASAIEENGGGGGTSATPEKDEEEEATEDFSEKIERIYERTSRERLRGIRPTYEPVKTEAPEAATFRSSFFLATDPVVEEESVAPSLDVPAEPPAPSGDGEVAPEPAPEKVIMAKERPVRVTELTERENAVIAVYTRLANELGRKPSPLVIAEEIGIKGTRGGISASVCTALASARRKGVELPFIDERPKRLGSGEKNPRTDRPKKVRAEKKPRRAKKNAAVVRKAGKPRSSVAPTAALAVVPSADPMKNFLLLEKERLEKKLAAVTLLLEV